MDIDACPGEVGLDYTGRVTGEHSDDGVDLTLTRWMLSLTPGERLAVLQDQVDSLLILRAKFESHLLEILKRR
jgi:hypothetical protein